MKPTPDLMFGPKKLREWAAEVGKIIKSLTPLPGVGTTITEDPNGAGFSVNTKGAAPDNALPDFPTTAGTKWALTYTVDTATLAWTQLDSDC